MSTVPRWIAVILALLVVAVVWFVGTRELDFLQPPSAAEIEMAKAGASQKLARPSNLFAVASEPVAPPPIAEPVKPAKPSPSGGPPKILIGDLQGAPPLDGWIDQSEAPAASFIDLASRLEADTQMAWARVAWERVIDLSEADDDELQAAIKGVLRTRSAPTALSGEERPKLQLVISTPSDRVELTKRAAADATEQLAIASSGLIAFTSDVTSSSELKDEIEIGLGAGSVLSSIRITAPAEPSVYTEALLQAAFRLVSSQLATNDGLRPVTQPSPGEKITDSLSTRVTRRGWSSFANAFKSQE